MRRRFHGGVPVIEKFTVGAVVISFCRQLVFTVGISTYRTPAQDHGKTEEGGDEGDDAPQKMPAGQSHIVQTAHAQGQAEKDAEEGKDEDGYTGQNAETGQSFPGALWWFGPESKEEYQPQDG